MFLKFGQFIRRLHGRIERNGKSYIVYTILRILVIVTAVLCLIGGDYGHFALCIASLFIFLIPAFFTEKLLIGIPPFFEIMFYLFIFASWILGEVNRYYTMIPGWDTMLHAMTGAMCAIFGFSLFFLLNQKSEGVNLSPGYMALVALCFAMTIGVFWEFTEFAFDQTLYLDMQKDFIVQTIGSVTLDPDHTQKSIVVDQIARTIIETGDGSRVIVEGGYLDIGIIDTMKDLIVCFIGASAFCLIGYFYVRKHEGSDLSEKIFLKKLTKEQIDREDKEIDEAREERNRAIGKLRKKFLDDAGTKKNP